MSTSATSSAAKAISILGGPVEAARVLGIDRYQTVQSWRSAGVPARYCTRVERLTGSQVTRQELRPNDWRDYWPELEDSSKKQPSALSAKALPATKNVAQSTRKAA